MPDFKLGFLQFANMRNPLGLGKLRDLFGQPLEAEHYNEIGNSEQQTANGLMAWRKADNWTAWTDGYWTYINGPNGIQRRLNSERFDWEADGYRPTQFFNPNPSVVGEIESTPRGILVHGTRSGRRQSIYSEFHGTRGWAQAGAGGLAWQITVGDDAIATHLAPDEWGWHCRSPWSELFLGIEFAQPTVEYDITDAQVRAACWWIRNVAMVRWPDLPYTVLLAHSEIDPGIRDGKTDPFPRGDARNDDLRARMLGLLAA